MKPGTGLYPNAYYSKFTDIKIEDFLGRPYCIIDVDNTLTLKSSAEIRPEVTEFLKELREKGVVKEICLVSNVIFLNSRRRKRLENVATQLKAHWVHASGRYSKPHWRSFEEAMKKMAAKPENTLVIGDQLFTDIKGGNSLGLYTILVQPLGKDAWFTRPKRVIERYVRKRWKLY